MYEHGKLGISVNTSPIMALLLLLAHTVLLYNKWPKLYYILHIVAVVGPTHLQRTYDNY